MKRSTKLSKWKIRDKVIAFKSFEMTKKRWLPLMLHCYAYVLLHLQTNLLYERYWVKFQWKLLKPHLVIRDCYSYSENVCCDKKWNVAKLTYIWNVTTDEFCYCNSKFWVSKTEFDNGTGVLPRTYIICRLFFFAITIILLNQFVFFFIQTLWRKSYN